LFIENRYAKIVEIEQRFQQSQQQISQAHFLSLELLSLLSTEQQQTIRHKLELSRENKNNSRD
jgi:cellobiose-specific phosphotransferase system component IIA